MTTSTDLSKLKAELLAKISAAKDLAELEAVRIDALGKKGIFASKIA